MQCPRCEHTQLVMSERRDVEIDYCPSCRGVWLDRGELDKILERSAKEAGAPTDRRERETYYRQHKKKKPWWMEVFD